MPSGIVTVKFGRDSNESQNFVEIKILEYDEKIFEKESLKKSVKNGARKISRRIENSGKFLTDASTGPLRTRTLHPASIPGFHGRTSCIRPSSTLGPPL